MTLGLLSYRVKKPGLGFYNLEVVRSVGFGQLGGVTPLSECMIYIFRY